MVTLSSRTLVATALGGYCVAALVGIHALPRFGTALMAGSGASAVLETAMARNGLLRGRFTKGLLATWCAGVLVVVVFTKDPDHTPPTIYGTWHLTATVTVAVTLPALGFALWQRFRTHPRWRPWARRSGALAAANVACLLPLLVAWVANADRAADQSRFTGLPAVGVLERVMVGLDIAAMVAFALWNRAAGREGRRPCHGDFPCGTAVSGKQVSR